MVEIGKVGTLEVARIGPYGVYLDGEEHGEVLLLRAGAQKQVEIGEQLKVFIYIDSDDTLVASAIHPTIEVGQCAALKVVSLTDHGAFLDWGLNADLFVPRSEQMGDMGIGSLCVVMAMLDESSHRMIASAKLYQYLADEADGVFKAGQSVDLLVCQRTDLGYKAVVDGTHLGMIFHNEIFTDICVGDKREGFIKAIREDGKIDLLLQKSGAAGRGDLETRILEFLKVNGGISELTDKSPPEKIYAAFGVSKKAYKKALGGLYRSRLIVVSKEKIELIASNTSSG